MLTFRNRYSGPAEKIHYRQLSYGFVQDNITSNLIDKEKETNFNQSSISSVESSKDYQQNDNALADDEVDHNITKNLTGTSNNSISI